MMYFSLMSEDRASYGFINTVKDDPVWMVQEAAAGWNATVVEDIIALSGLPPTSVAERFFNMSYKTITRYIKADRSLNPRDSETAIRLMLLFQKGIEIFGSLKSFNAWMAKPAFGLGDRLPVDLLTTHTGIELVKEELLRIEYGALA